MLLDESPDPIYACTPEGRYLFANRAFATAIGRPLEQIIGYLIRDVFSQATADSRTTALQDAIRTGIAQEVELRVTRSDGERFYVTTITPVRNSRGEVTTAICSAKDITRRKRAEDQLRRSLAEKEVLLQEVHHRVKNNLSVISGLLKLQASLIQSPEQAMAAFQNSRDRISAMALVHAALYQTSDYASIDMDAYLTKLTRQLILAYGGRGDIHLDARAGEVTLNMNAAIPCGLILNELITNAFKYAFPQGGPGHIHVELRSLADSHFEFTVTDDGIGLPADFENRDSLGLTLVRLLTR